MTPSRDRVGDGLPHGPFCVRLICPKDRRGSIGWHYRDPDDAEDTRQRIDAGPHATDCGPHTVEPCPKRTGV